MPNCPSCGSHDVERVDADEYDCNDCGCAFSFDGDDPEEIDMDVEGDSLDMQAFEDRISCLGDD